MNKPLTYGTVCSGIECMSAAALGLPLKPLPRPELDGLEMKNTPLTNPPEIWYNMRRQVEKETLRPVN